MSISIERIGFVGLGNMGTPMASRLIEAGYQVAGFDLAPEARQRLAEAGGTAVETAVAAAEGADLVILMLPNSDIVENVVLNDGVLDALAEGAIIADMSSSEPLRTQALAEKVSAAGRRLIDAPVSGGVKGAVAGTLAIMVGASEEELAILRPVLEVLGKPTLVGPVGAGHALKALNNLMSAIHLWGSSEALLAGIRFGLDPEVILPVINASSGRSGSTDLKWPNFIVPETYNSGFGLRLMLKDMKIAQGLEESMGVSHELADLAVERWSRAAEDLPPNADHTEVARWIKEHSAS